MEETSIKRRLSLSSGNERLQLSRQYYCLKAKMRKDKMQTKQEQEYFLFYFFMNNNQRERK